MILDLMGQTWVSDDIVSNYFDVLMLKIVGSKGKSYLVNPNIVEAIKGLNDINVVLDPSSLNDMDILLLPLNDAQYDHENVNSYKSVSG